MKYLVDTSFWSLVLRRREQANEKASAFLSELISQRKVVLCGAIRQELLSGIKRPEQFILLKTRLQSFEDLVPDTKDYELAAEFFNICRSKGIQGSNTDFLLCAISANHKLSLLTTDKDFLLFNKHINFDLSYLPYDD